MATFVILKDRQFWGDGKEVVCWECPCTFIWSMHWDSDSE